MTKEQIIKMRNLLKGEDNKRPIIIFLDNAELMDENTELVIWDDNNELLYSVSLNPSQFGNHRAPAMLRVSSYDMIQDLKLLSDIKTAQALIAAVKADQTASILINEESLSIKKILNDIAGDESTYL